MKLILTKKKTKEENINILIENKNNDEKDNNDYIYNYDSENYSKNVDFNNLLKDQKRKLKTIKKVYDSLSEDEIAKNINYDRFFIHPDSWIKKAIDCSTFLSCIFSFIYTPLNLIFQIITNLNFVFVEIYFDLINLLDFILGFFSDTHKTTQNYLRSYLFIDLIALIPFNTYIRWYEYNLYSEDEKKLIIADSGNIYNNLIFVNEGKFYMMLRIIRVFKCF